MRIPDLGVSQDGSALVKARYVLKIAVVSNEARELNAYRIRTFQLTAFVDFFISSCFVHVRKPMNEPKHPHRHADPDDNQVPHGRPPGWKRVHRDWRFWAVLLMLAAMVVYVLSDDLAWQPRSQPSQPLPVAVE